MGSSSPSESVSWLDLIVEPSVRVSWNRNLPETMADLTERCGILQIEVGDGRAPLREWLQVGSGFSIASFLRYNADSLE